MKDITRRSYMPIIYERLIAGFLITLIIMSISACNVQDIATNNNKGDDIKMQDKTNKESQTQSNVITQSESVTQYNLTGEKSSNTTFRNPIKDKGADPYVYRHTDGYYYYTCTSGDKITLAKSKTITGLKSEPARTIWNPPNGKPNSIDIWAPEIHFLKGKWYIYYAARGSDRNSRRMFVLENSSADPLERSWVDKGKLSDPSDKWAIDGTVFENRGKMYFVWSGWEDNDNTKGQNIYIAEMSNTYTISSQRVEISRPDFEWEKKKLDVNEGPSMLKRNGKVFIVYSASHYSVDDYCLGMLTAEESSDLLKTESWKKSERPVFQKSIENEAYGPGHNSLTKSPDGKEDWIVYHGYSSPVSTPNSVRSARIQKFTWDSQGYPDFGIPLPINIEIAVPSGE